MKFIMAMLLVTAAVLPLGMYYKYWSCQASGGSIETQANGKVVTMSCVSGGAK